ncbi:MAG TPA: glycoside hydrolase family 43 protein [Gaiellaceae bacterium]|nr:glycoside hydrolase family 43 protein [Gaiellaceae bacterium]
MDHPRRLLALLAVAVALGGCGGSQESDDAAPVDAAQSFTNPVYTEDFPDPFVLAADGRYFAYATNTSNVNVQTLTSKDLVDWVPGKDALPELGSWATEGKTWAPEVLALDGGGYVLYYTASDIDSYAQCIGRAVADDPGGPFVDDSPRPLVCQADLGGSIDPSPFRDEDGTLYLLWKNDGNCCGQDTYLYSQRLAPDGRSLTGKSTRLVKQDAAWEGNLVEAPTLWREGDRLYLFYSANDYASEVYAIGYATCETPAGPCADAPENPIVSTACEAAGPGHQSLFRDADGKTWIVYHAWPPDAVGSVLPGRLVWLDRVEWKNAKPDVLGPTCSAQDAPAVQR